MAIKTANGYACGYCGKEFTDPIDCENHKETHNLIYLPLSQEDLHRLLQFIYSKEDGLITETLLSNLQKYVRGSFMQELMEK